MSKRDYAKKLYETAQQMCLQLHLTPDLGSANRILNAGKVSIRSNTNYMARKDCVDIALKPYTNEFGEQEPFGDICERDLEYAEKFVEKNMSRGQGLVNNMTEASMYVIRCQREEIKRLKS